MKSIPYLILTLLVVGCSSEPVDPSRLVERNGITCVIAEDGTSTKPYSGKAVSFHLNGQLKEKGAYKDGKPDGAYEEYHANGQLKEKGTFKDGKRIID